MKGTKKKILVSLIPALLGFGCGVILMLADHFLGLPFSRAVVLGGAGAMSGLGLLGSLITYASVSLYSYKGAHRLAAPKDNEGATSLLNPSGLSSQDEVIVRGNAKGGNANHLLTGRLEQHNLLMKQRREDHESIMERSREAREQSMKTVEFLSKAVETLQEEFRKLVVADDEIIGEHYTLGVDIPVIFEFA